MVNTINFLNQHRENIVERQQRERTWFRWSIGFFAFVAVLSAALVGATFFIQFRINTTQQRISAVEQQVLAQQDVEESVVILVEKLKTLAQLLEIRSDKQEALSFFTDLFGSQVLVRQIAYEADSSILSLRLETPSYFTLQNMFELLDRPETREQYPFISKSELRRSQSAAYSMAITVILDEALAERVMQQENGSIPPQPNSAADPLNAT